MKITPSVDVRHLFASAIAIAIAVSLCGCPASEEKKPQSSKPVVEQPEQPVAPAASETVEPAEKTPPPAPAEVEEPAADVETSQPKEPKEPSVIMRGQRDLGPPLVDNPEQLVPLAKDQPVWLDRPNGQVILLGEVCEPAYLLEFFATYANRSYESVLAVNATPSIVHTGLVAVGEIISTWFASAISETGIVALEHTAPTMYLTPSSKITLFAAFAASWASHLESASTVSISQPSARASSESFPSSCNRDRISSCWALEIGAWARPPPSKWSTRASRA